MGEQHDNKTTTKTETDFLLAPSIYHKDTNMKKDDDGDDHHHYNNNKQQRDHKNRQYFTVFNMQKATLYGIMAIYVVSVGFVATIEPLLHIPCEDPGEVKEYANPAYDGSNCRYIRYAILLGLTKQECAFARRLVMSVLLGGLIGWERRQADRPAGIRTMSLVSLGSCLFTINSTFAFMDGPNEWDASRISAAIPSGVGFLGAGLIFKKDSGGTDSSPVVSGLTTAASLWLSAAVGIACGGDLYFAASFGVAIMMLLLRFGPRGFEGDDDEDNTEADAGGEDLEGGGGIDLQASTRTATNLIIGNTVTTHQPQDEASMTSNTRKSLTEQQKKARLRKKKAAALATDV